MKTRTTNGLQIHIWLMTLLSPCSNLPNKLLNFPLAHTVNCVPKYQRCVKSTFLTYSNHRDRWHCVVFHINTAASPHVSQYFQSPYDSNAGRSANIKWGKKNYNIYRLGFSYVKVHHHFQLIKQPLLNNSDQSAHYKTCRLKFLWRCPL
jgi:hypothetical protein